MKRRNFLIAAAVMPLAPVVEIAKSEAYLTEITKYSPFPAALLEKLYAYKLSTITPIHKGWS